MTSRIAIVGGGGGVGASLAFNLLTAPAPYDVALVDGRSGMARSHEMDLQQVIAAGATGSIRIVGLAEAAEADVVVISASVPLTVNTSRMVYLRDNAAILAQVGRALPRDWPGVAVVVTNPVDPFCTWLQRATGLYRDPANWQRVMRQAMTRDFSWDAAAQLYARLYRELAPASL